MFATAFMAGFECSTHRRADGRRLDLIAATAHDRHAASDYALLRRHGIGAARDGLRWHLIEASPGRYDWSSFLPMRDAARGACVDVFWDLLHYGWPDWTDPWAADFIDRFADFAEAAAARIGPGGRYVPINEISFLSWAGGEVAYLNPFSLGRGAELKELLCRAAIMAIERIRFVDPAATIMAAEPLINVIPADVSFAAEEEARGLHRAQRDAADMILGRRAAELGGNESLIDVVGLNFYPYNQFTHQRETVERGDPRYVPLRDLLIEAARHYRKPLALAETGCEGPARAEWLDYVAGEVRAANALGAGVGGICLYPILNHPGWDDDRYCPNGLFCGVSTQRTPHSPLVDELDRQQRLEPRHWRMNDPPPAADFARLRAVGRRR